MSNTILSISARLIALSWAGCGHAMYQTGVVDLAQKNDIEVLLTAREFLDLLPGTKHKRGGFIKHCAKLLFAYAEATVPKTQGPDWADVVKGGAAFALRSELCVAHDRNRSDGARAR